MSDIRRLNITEMKNLEKQLLTKKMKFRVKNGVIKKKCGQRSGQTLYIISEKTREELKAKKNLKILEFCKLYNDQLDLVGASGIYTKLVRNKMILNYFFTKGWLRITGETTRTRKGIAETYKLYAIPAVHTKQVLEFINKYLSSEQVDNSAEIQKAINNNKGLIKNPEKLTSDKSYKVKTGLRRKIDKDVLN